MLLSDVHSGLNSVSSPMCGCSGLRHCLEAAMRVAAVCQKVAPGGCSRVPWMSHAVMMAGCELMRLEQFASKSALSFQQSYV